jgi:hypothetical protein
MGYHTFRSSAVSDTTARYPAFAVDARRWREFQEAELHRQLTDAQSATSSGEAVARRSRINWARVLLAAVVVGGAIALGHFIGGSGGDTRRIDRATYSGAWPFTVDDGTLGCDGPGWVTFGANGTTYYMNVLASAHAEAENLDGLKICDNG